MAKALTAGSRRKKVLAVVVLLLLLLANATLLGGTWYCQEDVISGALYGLNAAFIVLLLGTIALPWLFTEKNPYHALTTPLFFSLVGTSAGIVLLISAAMSFGDDYTINGPLAFITCVATVATYVYFIFQRDLV